VISDIPQQAHLMSLRGWKMSSPTREVSYGDEPSAISAGTFDGQVCGPVRQ
jgi:hypothetical protein